jgi:hypothetical protein
MSISRRKRCAGAALLKPGGTSLYPGYGMKLFLDHVTQAHLGCDFDFLGVSERIAS